MTAEERARDLYESAMDSACEKWALAVSAGDRLVRLADVREEAIIAAIAAALTDAHATGKAEGEREGLEKAALVADNFCTGEHLVREHVLAEGIATAIRSLLDGAKHD
jgi:hypothetical protein